MDYSKVYNPEINDFNLWVGDKQFTIPARGFIIIEEKVAEALRKMAACLEIVPATEAEFKGQNQINVPAEKPVVEKPKEKGKKGKK